MAKDDKKKPTQIKAKTQAKKSASKPVVKPKAKQSVNTSKNQTKVAVNKASKPISSKPVPVSKAETKKSSSINKEVSHKAKPDGNKKAEPPKPELKPIATVKAKISPILENKKPVTKSTTKTETPPSTNGKTRYSDQELAEFKLLIDEKLTAARKELNYLQEQIVEMNENNSDIQGSDWFDDSSIHSEVELLNNMAIRQRQFIQNLENALIRIENKTYGICIITGNLIDKKRLLLVPHATKSIEAKHIEQATMVPDLNTVAPDERVLRRTAEGKSLKKGPAKKAKGKASRDFEDEDGDDGLEAPVEEIDLSVEADD